MGSAPPTRSSYFLNANTKICKGGDFNFVKVSFPFLDGDVPRSSSYGTYLFVLQAYVHKLMTSTTENSY